MRGFPVTIQDINTAAGGAATLVEGLKQEIGAIERALIGSDFDETLLEPSRYEFGGNLSTLTPRARGLITSLAYSQARQNDPGGRLSENDVRQAMIEIGANLSDPKALVGVLGDVVGRADRDFRTRFRILSDGEEFSEDLGLDRFNSLVDGEPQRDLSTLSDDEFLNLLNQ